VPAENLGADRGVGRGIGAVAEEGRHLHQVGNPHFGLGQRRGHVGPDEAALLVDAGGDVSVCGLRDLAADEQQPGGTVHKQKR